MAVYNRMEHAIKAHKNYVKNNPRTPYLKEYNQIHAERISDQHRSYYCEHKERIKKRQKVYDRNKRNNG